MDIRARLKADFGIDVLIDRGIGMRNDPFVVLPCSAREASRTQLNLLRGLGLGRRELWRLLSAEAAPDVGPMIQCLSLEAIQFTPDQIITETGSYYFDVGQVEGAPNAAAPNYQWTDPRTRFAAPFQINWLHFDRAIDNNPGGRDLDTTLQYSTRMAQAGISVYGSPDLSRPDVRDTELRTTSDTVRSFYPDAETPWPPVEIGPLLVQYFLIGKNVSAAAIGLVGPHFVKLRLTFEDDAKMRQLMSDTVHEIARLVGRSAADA